MRGAGQGVNGRAGGAALAACAMWILVGPLDGRAQSPVSLPAIVEEFRFLLEPATEDGTVLALRVDTGGQTFLLPGAARRLEGSQAVPEPGAEPRWMRWPAFQARDAIPLPSGVEEGGARVEVRDDPARADGADGVLGAGWLHGRTWTFDYPGRRLILRAPGDLPLHGPDERIRIELPRAADGEILPGAPVLRVRVGGEEVPLALATDAHARLRPSAVAEIEDFRPELRAISRLAGPVFDRWRAAHPDWRVIEGAEAESGEPILEVRDLRLGGVQIERVWMLRDPSGDPGRGLAASTPLPVAGVLGGDVLREFRVTLDYRSGTAVFEPAGFP